MNLIVNLTHFLPTSLQYASAAPATQLQKDVDVDQNVNVETPAPTRRTLIANVSLVRRFRYSIFDAHREKIDLKVFVVVIPKEGWARVAAPTLLLVWHQLFRI